MKIMIEKIPPNTIISMTPAFHQLFNAAGCNPMCHCCKEWLPIGSQFKLSTIEELGFKYGSGNNRESSRMIPTGQTETKEVMLCENCTTEDYNHYQSKMFSENEKEYKRREKLHYEQGGGCFRINGKIIT